MCDVLEAEGSMARLRNSQRFRGGDRKRLAGDEEVMLSQEASRWAWNDEREPHEAGSVWILI